MNRRAVAALATALLLLVAPGCTGDEDDDAGEPTPGSTTTTTVVASDEWNAVVADPCELLTGREVGQVLEVEAPDPADGAPAGTCRYDLGDQRSVEVVLFRPLTEAARTDRLRGTQPGPSPDSRVLILDVPGAGAYVGDGAALVLIALRDRNGGELPPAARLTELVSLVGERIPAAPTPSASDPDPCALVPAATFGDDLLGGDPVDADTCAYRADDGTSVSVRVDPEGTMPEAGGLAEPWNEAAPGATWQGSDNDSGDGGSGIGYVPLDPGLATISVSSPARPLDELQERATAAAGLVVGD